MLVVHLWKQRKNKKSKEAGDSKYIYQNELDEACFQHDLAYGYFKYLNGRAFGDYLWLSIIW